MAKRSQQSVPSFETGAAAGDFNRSQSIAWKNKGGRNATTEQSRRGAGQLAPKPNGGAALLGNDRPSHPVTASMARVKNAGGAGPNASHLPVQNNAMRNLTGQSTGQAEVAPRGPGISIGPKTQTAQIGNPVATQKPKRRGKGAAFFGEYPS